MYMIDDMINDKVFAHRPTPSPRTGHLLPREIPREMNFGRLYFRGLYFRDSYQRFVLNDNLFPFVIYY